jgi:hypothetical protein
VLRRYLDILAQYARVIVVAAAVVPTLLVAANLVLDRTQLVTARIWIPGPVFVLDARVNGQRGTPADGQARLMQDLVGTDSFVDEVLAGAGVVPAGDATSRAAQRTRFRSNLQIVSQGDQLLSVSYRSRRAIDGINLLDSLIKAYGASTVELQLQNALRRSPVSAVDLRAARAAVDQYFSAKNFRLVSGRSTVTAGSPEALLVEVGAAADQYRRQLANGLPLASGSSDVSSLQAAAFTLVDPPAVEHTSTVHRAVTLFAEGLAAVVGGALLLAYILAATGARIRTGADAEHAIGIRFLGTAGVMGQV